MGGFIATELAIHEPERVERLVLVSAAGVTFSRARREPAAVLGRVMRAAAPLAFRYQMEGLRRRGLRHRAYRGIVHDPVALDPRLLFEITVPALQAPGFYDAMTTLVGYDIRDRLVEIEVPTLIVWGRNDRVVPRRRGAHLQGADRRQRPARDLRPLRAPADARAAGPLQPADRRLPPGA